MTDGPETVRTTTSPGCFAFSFSPGRMWRLGIYIALLGLVSATGFSLLARHFWIAELATHFKLQYAVVAFILVLALSVARDWRGAVVSAVFLVWHLVGIVPFYLPCPNATPEAANFRVVLCNVLGSNKNTADFIAYVHEADADVVIVQELRPHWETALEAIHESYPYRRVIAQTGFFGVGQYSKYPFEEMTSPDNVSYGFPHFVSRIDVDGASVVLGAIHTAPPVNRQNSLHRVDTLGMLREELAALDDPILVMGDLNMSPWSPHFKDFAEALRLTDARRGTGVLPSWPARVGKELAIIPIDYILAGSGVGVVHCERGPAVGSDHYPILADLHIPTGP